MRAPQVSAAPEGRTGRAPAAAAVGVPDVAGTVPTARVAPDAGTPAGPSPRVPPERWRELITAVLQHEAPADLVAQPIVDLSVGGVVGYELLARFGWPERAGGVALTQPPDRWFAAAGELGLAPALTAEVLRRALELRPGLPEGTFCTVNVGPEVLPHPLVQAVLDCHDVHRLVLELTEHSAGEPTPELLRHLDELRDRGALVAVDDAGSGYAGLSRLLAVRPDLVKLDRRLVAGLDGDPRRRDVVETLESLCRRLGAVLLAEGIETAAECEALVRLGVALGQGWFLARPARPWPPVTVEVGPWVRSLARETRVEGSVLALTRPLTPQRGTHPWLVWDGDRAPVSLVYRGGGQVLTAPVVEVPASTPLPVALRRALARPEPHRWAPLVVSDGDGGVIGWLDVGEVVQRVAVPEQRSPGVALHARH